MFKKMLSEEELTTLAIVQINSSKPEKVEELVKFYKKVGLIPIPIPENGALTVYEAGPSNTPQKLLAMYRALDVKIVTGRMDFSKMPTDIDRYKPVEKEFSATFGGHKVGGKTEGYQPIYTDLYEVRLEGLASWLSSWLMKQMERLTNDELITYLQLLRPSLKKHDKDLNECYLVCSNTKVSINFETLCVKARSTRYAKKYCYFEGEMRSTKGVLAMILLTIGSKGNPNGFLNSLPNLWMRDPQYAINAIGNPFWEDNPTKWIMDYSIQGVRFTYSPTGFPFISITNTSFDGDIIREVLDQGHAIVLDKYAMSDVGNTMAAHAAGQGRRIIHSALEYCDEILTMHDCSKPSKFLNRVTQARRFLQAHVEYMERSPFRVEITPGHQVAQSGIKLKTCVAKTTLNFGSGPAAVRPDLEFTTIVRKTGLRGKFVWLRFSKTMRDRLTEKGRECGFDKEPGLEYLKRLVSQQCESLIEEGKVYNPHETVLKIAYDGNRKSKLIKNDMLNQPVKLIGFDLIDNANEAGHGSQWFEITFDVELVDKSPVKKFRNDFVKLTCLRQPITWYDDKGTLIPNWGDVDICLNNETVKGRSLEMAMFTITYGGGYILPSEGKLFLDFPERCPYLSDEEREEGIILYGDKENKVIKPNAIHRWIEDTKEVRYIQIRMAKREWEYYSKCHDRSYFESVVEHETYVEITEKVECLVGEYFFAVELSTPLENTGRSSLTVQQLSTIGILDKELAEHIYKESREYRHTTLSLISMLTKEGAKALPLVNVSKSKVRKRLKADLLKIQGNGLIFDGKSDSEIINMLHKLFPNGIRLAATSGHTGDTISCVVLFDVLRSMTEFIGGAAKGISASIVSLINFAVTCEEDKSIEGTIFGYIKLIRDSLKSWFDAVKKSKSLYKRIAQTDKVLVGGKIKTSYSPVLNHEEEDLPNILLHPKCDIVRELCKDSKGRIYDRYMRKEEDEDGNIQSYFDPMLLDGDIVGLMRTPMVMMGAFRVSLNPITADIGHVHVLAYLWSLLTEGDSDGDGVNTLNLSARGVDESRAKSINSNVMSFRGYEFVYGPNANNHPYAGFSDPKDNIKKGFNNFVPYVTRINTNLYLDTASKIANHYKGPVGIGYGISSVLSFRAIDLLYKFGEGDLEFKLTRGASAFAWRLIYEGLGLSGWTAEGEEFFDKLWKTNAAVLYRKGSITTNSKFKTDDEQTADQMFERLLELSGFSYTPEDKSDEIVLAARKAILKRVLLGNRIRMGFGAITRNAPWKKYIQPEEKLEYSIYGALREASRGQDSAGTDSFHVLDELDSIGDDETIPESLFSLVLKHELWNRISCPWLAEVLRESSICHHLLNEYLYKEEKMEEDYGLGL